MSQPLSKPKTPSNHGWPCTCQVCVRTTVVHMGGGFAPMSSEQRISLQHPYASNAINRDVIALQAIKPRSTEPWSTYRMNDNVAVADLGKHDFPKTRLYPVEIKGLQGTTGLKATRGPSKLPKPMERMRQLS
ncbi:hypothetical protein CLAFUW4_10349 [Fulvia fulva]|uniref:Uncharacterized protein n=1 Tax=Passalora fulva TaxID=5499 RepID=A0A9Q8LEW6_PASFU|nr:uncharacterized protein CLAFUR5_04964 [Fulvia fulva]KAK4616274.1 hypothetical protein CLAFUR4_10353 [Fulvia fulva]KAK4617081.1 hypothetical protein CLAFUR0_10353 [Fulvia fulva]UJO16220.1 hypothetical protein CLAFUR5_04964 [Fulvia fulva]WPV18936.1 hypothetical protein CLAFUW4_10349 [Fulvia fulva]WPV33949.1 hypothetical protein CLAFUW7_10349 [Fulvia fulva]